VNFREATESALALLVVGGLVTIAIYDNISGRPTSIPAELYGFGGIVIGAYFRGSATVSAFANGAVAKIAKALNTPPAAMG
jgi:hypothetical protein